MAVSYSFLVRNLNVELDILSENKLGLGLHVGGLLLAAGGSSRFGSPKQLASFDGKTLIRQAAEALAGSFCNTVVAVLGHEYAAALQEISDLRLVSIENKNWESGMSTSIKAGLEFLLKTIPELDAVVITLCDQPLVTSDKIDLLITDFLHFPSEIVAAEYDGTIGVPALFSKSMFAELLKLEGDTGARKLIRMHSDQLRAIEMKEAAFDIDLRADIA